MQIPTTVAAMSNGSDAISLLNGQMYPSKLLRVSIVGPAGSRAIVYRAGDKVDETSRGMSNSNEFTHPVELPSGTPVSIVWPGQAANASLCSATFTVER